jgi:site-specific DNA-methyltransferase (adenine-specific)
MLELNRIHQGDSTQKLKELDSNSVQLVVTSPPYFAYKDYGDDEGNIENLPSYEEYVDYFEEWFKELYRVVDEDGRVCIVVDDKHTNLKTEGVNKNRATHARLIMLAERQGFVYKDLIIWAKARAGHASGGADKMLGSYPYPPNIPCVSWFEYILIFRKDGKPRTQRVTTQQKELSKLTMKQFNWACESIWKITPERGQEHPCPFPEEIARRLIQLFSFYGDTVLDPFMGSGTTAMASKTLGRQYVGIELNPDFCKQAKMRLTQNLLFISSEKNPTEAI